MRKYKEITKSYQDKILEKCICDKCNQECILSKPDEYKLDRRSVISVTAKWTDGYYIDFDLCPQCTREFVNWIGQSDDIQDFQENMLQCEECQDYYC